MANTRQEDPDYVILWKFIAAMAMAMKPETFMDFCNNFLELSTEEDEAEFIHYYQIVDPLLDDMEEQFKDDRIDMGYEGVDKGSLSRS